MFRFPVFKNEVPKTNSLEKHSIAEVVAQSQILIDTHLKTLLLEFLYLQQDHGAGLLITLEKRQQILDRLAGYGIELEHSIPPETQTIASQSWTGDDWQNHTITQFANEYKKALDSIENLHGEQSEQVA